MNFYGRGAGGRHLGHVFGDFGLHAGALDRDDLATRLEKRQAPLDEVCQSRDSSGRHDICSDFSPQCLGFAAMDRDVREFELCHGALQPCDAALQRLDQMDMQVRPGHRQHDPWKAGTRADISDRRALADDFADHNAIEHVPIPESGDLPWADETMVYTSTGEDRDKLLQAS